MGLEEMTVRQLRSMAAGSGIAGRSEMNRKQLIAALSGGSIEERVERLEARVSALEQKSSAQDIDHIRLGS